MSRTNHTMNMNAMSFPRVSGDEPALPTHAWYVDRFSPRERG